jgi:hypothetical protein
MAAPTTTAGQVTAKGGKRFYLWLLAEGFPEGFQTLCRRCNMSKGVGERCRLWHVSDSLRFIENILGEQWQGLVLAGR